MDSNITLIGSIVIGGIFMMSLMSFYGSLTEYSAEKTLELLSQETTASFMEIINHDFRKIGGGVASPAIAITDTFSLTFFADVDEDGTVDEVQYSLSTTALASSTPNPNDRILYRTVNGVQTVNTAAGVTAFNVDLLDQYGNFTTTLMNTWQVVVSITVESPLQIDGQYPRTVWEHRIAPNNLVRPTLENYGS